MIFPENFGLCVSPKFSGKRKSFSELNDFAGAYQQSGRQPDLHF
jgi:hypothetical protein